MSDIEGIVEAAVQKRLDLIRAMDADFRQLQEQKLKAILRHAADTEFGRAHGFDAIGSVEEYQRRVPPSSAVDYHAAWARIEKGERNVLFPDPVYSYALSSGTTGEPKKVPLTKALVRGMRRVLGYTTSAYMARTGNFSLLRGYALQVAGPTDVRPPGSEGPPVGFITGIVGAARTYPFHNIAIPPAEVLDLEDWNEKNRIIEERYADYDVRMVFGIPGYIFGLLDRLMAKRGIDNLDPLWPNMQLAATSGTALRSSRARFAKACPHAECVEMYLATEGPFAFQPAAEPGMMPMVEDVFLEFVPEDRREEENAPRLTLAEVETGVRYVVLVTTPSGLYAYSPEDVVSFLSVDPPRLLVEGRYGNVLNLAAEKLDGQQAERILHKAGLSFRGFTVCPAESQNIPGHEWIVEFVGAAPADAADRIDRVMCAGNPIYGQLRDGGIMFACPLVTSVPGGTFQAALSRRRGQGKILRVYQDRRVRDELVGGP